jgi:E3 ubiquitin-protein ligase UBR7
MEALGQMDRVKQVEAIQSYNNMKDNLMEYLAKFANSNKVVREEDIKTFFEEMKSNKRRRIEGAPPSNCK